MSAEIATALAKLRRTSEQLVKARAKVASLEPQQSLDLRAARDAGASEAQMVAASGLSRVTVWKRLKP